MKESQIIKIQNFIATNIGINNPYVDKIKNAVIKAKELLDIEKEIPQELHLFTVLLILNTLSSENSILI